MPFALSAYELAAAGPAASFAALFGAPALCPLPRALTTPLPGGSPHKYVLDLAETIAWAAPLFERGALDSAPADDELHRSFQTTRQSLLQSGERDPLAALIRRTVATDGVLDDAVLCRDIVALGIEPACVVPLRAGLAALAASFDAQLLLDALPTGHASPPPPSPSTILTLPDPHDLDLIFELRDLLADEITLFTQTLFEETRALPALRAVATNFNNTLAASLPQLADTHDLIPPRTFRLSLSQTSPATIIEDARAKAAAVLGSAPTPSPPSAELDRPVRTITFSPIGRASKSRR